MAEGAPFFKQIRIIMKCLYIGDLTIFQKKRKGVLRAFLYLVFGRKHQVNYSSFSGHSLKHKNYDSNCFDPETSRTHIFVPIVFSEQLHFPSPKEAGERLGASESLLDFNLAKQSSLWRHSFKVFRYSTTNFICVPVCSFPGYFYQFWGLCDLRIPLSIGDFLSEITSFVYGIKRPSELLCHNADCKPTVEEEISIFRLKYSVAAHASMLGLNMQL